ncbi:putative T7SS-secreted protein, partial [Streptomyces sp. NPDC048551]|uniref:putative T7SS-secreted protein n=1 Tax=Streptomyces sp. NPDC048551 TaxID=3155758 RepID=UPI0034161E9B
MGRDLQGWLDAGKRALGDGVEWVGHKAGTGLDQAGLHQAADVVREVSEQLPGVRSTATALSAEDPYEIGGYRLHARL